MRQDIVGKALAWSVQWGGMDSMLEDSRGSLGLLLERSNPFLPTFCAVRPRQSESNRPPTTAVFKYILRWSALFGHHDDAVSPLFKRKLRFATIQVDGCFVVRRF